MSVVKFCRAPSVPAELAEPPCLSKAKSAESLSFSSSLWPSSPGRVAQWAGYFLYIAVSCSWLESGQGNSGVRSRETEDPFNVLHRD